MGVCRNAKFASTSATNRAPEMILATKGWCSGNYNRASRLDLAHSIKDRGEGRPIVERGAVDRPGRRLAIAALFKFSEHRSRFRQFASFRSQHRKRTLTQNSSYHNMTG
jgi:hypothetical protein